MYKKKKKEEASDHLLCSGVISHFIMKLNEIRMRDHPVKIGLKVIEPNATIGNKSNGEYGQ